MGSGLYPDPPGSGPLLWLTNSDGQFTFENILAIGTVENFKALCLSLLLSFISTLICLLLAYPLAMMLSNI